MTVRVGLPTEGLGALATMVLAETSTTDRAERLTAAQVALGMTVRAGQPMTAPADPPTLVQAGHATTGPEGPATRVPVAMGGDAQQFVVEARDSAA